VEEVQLSDVAGALGDRARAAIVLELLAGEPRPAAALARAAGVAPSTASAHLARLESAGLITVERAGRRRMHRLAGHEVAEAVEALMLVACGRGTVSPVLGLRAADRATAHRAARSCYDHLAGRFGVAVTDRLVAVGALAPESLVLLDPEPIERLGVDVDALAAGRRPLTRACVDWSERRPHLAGALGAAVLGALLERGWVRRRRPGRALVVTPAGSAGLREALGLDVDPHAPATPARAAA
jgi:DNA-binding transcriptional ArsR family regulator